MCLSQTPRDWAVNRFTACPFNSLSAYNGGWHAGRGAEGRAVCVQREPGCARGKVRAKISAGKRRGGLGQADSSPPLPLPPSPSRTSSRPHTQ